MKTKTILLVPPRAAIRHPESEVILKAVRHNLGLKEVIQLTKGTFFQMEIEGSEEEARQIATRATQQLLHNPITQDFSVHFPEGAQGELAHLRRVLAQIKSEATPQAFESPATSFGGKLSRICELISQAGL